MLRLNVGRVTIPANTPTEIVPARSGRKELRLSSVSGLTIGPDSSVTVSNGFDLTFFLFENFEDALWGVYGSSPSAKIVQFLEIYDDGM